jgi:hypothetical protein
MGNDAMLVNRAEREVARRRPVLAMRSARKPQVVYSQRQIVREAINYVLCVLKTSLCFYLQF